MDDESAEIELLEQNLNKTKQISQRMTSMLSSFDTRLNKLEKSILPLYNSTQILTKRGNNIESALLKIYEIASNQEGLAAEEAMILRGPQPGQLEQYKDTLSRLNASVTFMSITGGQRDTARLIETGAKKLTQMYTKLVAEGSSGVPPNGPDFQLLPFPSALRANLEPLVAFLRTLPLPPTHPSHPAAPGIQSTLKEAQKGYADMRGSWSVKCLEQYGKRVVDRAETLDGVVAGRELGAWVENLLAVAEIEYGLLKELSPLPGPVESTFAKLIAPLATLFANTISSLGSLIKRSLHKYTFLALAAYANLSASQAAWDDIMVRRAGRKQNELKEGLHAIRASCLRSFPEFIADIKTAALGKGAEVGTGLIDFAISTVEYLERMPEVQSAVGAALQTLGDGNWKMGEGVQVGKAGKTTETNERTLMEHFLHDVIHLTVTSLQTLSRANKRPSFGSIFLVNNLAYLRTRILVKPKTDIPSLLSKPTQDLLNSNFRTAKAAYFDSNFSPLMQTLTEDNKGKSAAKEKFTRFFDLLDEVAETHKLARVLQDDNEGREQICDEVIKLVVPSLQRFTQRNASGKDYKSLQKYIKMSTEEVESLIRSFYIESDPRTVAQAENARDNLLLSAGWGRY
ncbi:Cullin repeat-like-containing domain protein [Abortiporus biennis]|nr:Cullin repeat-like-containing domain protein [Abortiporus biennis]